MPVTSGADIVQNKGDQALAGGFSNQPTPAGIGSDNLNAFDRTMNDILQQDYHWNVKQYEQKIKDRDDLYNTLATTNSNEMVDANGKKIEVPILEEDRPQIQQIKDKINNKVIDLVKKYGSIQANPTAWLDLKKDINAFDEAHKNSQSRYLSIADLKNQYANSYDEDEKKELAKFIPEQIGKGYMHRVEPFQKLISVDKDKVIPEVKPTEVTTGMKGDKIIKTISLDPNNFFQAYGPNSVTGPDVNHILAQANRVYNNFNWNDANITSLNNLIDQANKKWNTNISPVAQKDASGNWVPTTDPLVLRQALGLQRNWVDKTQEELSKTPQEIRHLKAETAQSFASANESNADAYYKNLQSKLLKDQIPYLVQEAANKAAFNKAQSKQAGSYVSTYLAAFGKYAEDKNYKPASQVVDSKDLSDLKSQTGLSDDSQLLVAPKGDETLSKTATVVNALGNNVPAEKMYVYKDPEGNVKIIGKFSEGKNITYKMIDLKNAIGNAIKSDNGKDNSTTPIIISNTESLLDNIPGNTWQEKYQNMRTVNAANQLSTIQNKIIPDFATAKVKGRDVNGPNGVTYKYYDNKWYDNSGKLIQSYDPFTKKYYNAEGKEIIK